MRRQLQLLAAYLSANHRRATLVKVAFMVEAIKAVVWAMAVGAGAVA